MDYWTIGFTLLAISLIALGVWAVLRYGSDDAPPKFDLQARLEQIDGTAAPYKVEPPTPTPKPRPHVRAVSVSKSAAAMKPRRKRQA